MKFIINLYKRYLLFKFLIYFILIILIIVFFVFSDSLLRISPRFSPKEQKYIDQKKIPFVSQNIYTNSLQSLGHTINETIGYRKIVQPLSIGNTAGGTELPFNLTYIVISSICNLSGKKFIVVPYNPEFTINDAQTGGKGTRVLPDLLINGSITEFDKNIEKKNNNVYFNFFTSKKNGSLSKRQSRIVLDLYLLDYKTHAVIPGIFVSNAIITTELNKTYDVGFKILSDNMEINGTIEGKYGFHKAIRNLVDYSILQLFGKYYDLPYWKLLNLKNKDSNVINSLVKQFSSESQEGKIIRIQKMLNRCDLSQDTSSNDISSSKSIPTNGILDSTTSNNIQKYLDKFKLPIASDNLPSIYVSLVENCSFNETHYTKFTR